jgi:uncharacterized ion transporter superfamily protein YfcC
MYDVRNEEELRAQALASLKKRIEFRRHLFVYAVINSMIVVVWAITGAGFFWPAFPMLGWGVGVIFHAQDVFSRGPNEEDIRREIERMR